jgi:hypothetical protein
MDMKTAELMQMIGKGADTQQVGGEHYKAMGIQPWTVMEAVLTRAEFEGYLKGCILKYGMRQGRKVDADDDAEKAKHYAQKLREIQDGYAGF